MFTATPILSLESQDGVAKSETEADHFFKVSDCLESYSMPSPRPSYVNTPSASMNYCLWDEAGRSVSVPS